MSPWSDRLKHVHPLRKIVYFFVGLFTYPGLVWMNRLRIEGTEHFSRLPPRQVLFVSNHQTYFKEVISFLHIFCAVKWGKQNRLGLPYYLLNPFTRVNYVAAQETMKGSLLGRIFLLAGGLTVKRTWREGDQDVQRSLDPADSEKVIRALAHNWVITFPQGTTKAYAPGRKGAALIIKAARPLVIPVVVSGFREAFNKKGLWFRRPGSRLTVSFKPPLDIDYDAAPEQILKQVMDAIEQSEQFKPESD